MSAGAPAREPAFHVPSLDGIRALSFLLVFVAHAGLGDIVPGGFGVTVFFFLSGYLITTLLRVEREKTGTVAFGEFYLRRALRILPPFYVVLSLAAIAAGIGVVAGGVAPRALAAQALHFANYWVVLYGYGGQPAGTGVYWSLAVEEHFYLVFPFAFVGLCHVVREPRARAAALWGLCLAVLAWRVVLVEGLHVAPDRTYVASDTRVDSILFGCALALYGNPALDGSRIAESTWKRVLLPLGVLTLLATFVVRDAALRETVRYTVQGAALVPVFVVAMRYPTWGPFRLLNLPIMSFLGVLSYPLYLVHHVVLEALAPWLGPGFVRGVIALALSTAIAWALHELVEKPSARLRRRLSAMRKGERLSASVPVVALAKAQEP